MTADIQTMLAALSRGEMIVLVDDEDRENEGDLLMAASAVTPAAINFMARHGRGLICLTLTDAHCRRLQLPMMSASNKSAFGTNFTVSIEAASGVGTGISAQDRAKTILAAANPAATADDIVSPGHIFPVRAEPGGVLVRAGHTEAGCDLAQMAGLFPAAVICEIMHEDGSMARMPQLQEFAAAHGLQIGAIKSLIEHRLRHERLIEREHETTVSTLCGAFRLVVYRDAIAGRRHLALIRGDIRSDETLPVRVALNPTVLDGLLLDDAQNSWGALPALSHIDKTGGGVLLMLAADERDDTAQKIRRQAGALPAPAAQPAGGSLRHYGLGAQILRDLGVGKMSLLSGKLHLPNMEAFGLSVEEIIEP